MRYGSRLVGYMNSADHIQTPLNPVHTYNLNSENIRNTGARFAEEVPLTRAVSKPLLRRL
jgi:hypothetical protein